MSADRPRPRPVPTPAREDRRRRFGFVAAGLAGAAVVIVVLVLVLRGSGGDPDAAPSTGASSGAVLTDPDAATAYVSAVSSAIVAVTSYDYRRLDDALQVGLTVTTGRYRTAYRAALTGAGASTVRREHTVSDFEVQRVGIGAVSAGGNRANLLVFGVQTITTGVSKRRTERTALVLTPTVERRSDGFRISELSVGTNAGLPPGSDELAVAAEAGRAGIVRQTGRAVTAVAVERATGDAVLMLAATAQARYEVAVQRSGDGWRPSAVTPLGSR